MGISCSNIRFVSRKLIGWAVSKKIDCKLVCKAFNNAVRAREISGELVHHSDRVIQYAANDFKKLLEIFNVQCSMSRRANCWDNAVAESFFGKLKSEHIQGFVFEDLEDAEHEIFWYIEVFYNRKRRHAYLGYVSPEEFEKQAIFRELVA